MTYYYYNGDNSLHKHVAAGVTTYYDYDAAGSLTKIHASGSDATYFEYDAAGRTSGIVPETPVSAAPALAIHYDADGALFHATEDDGSSAAENYFYYDKTSSNLELLARRRDGALDRTFLHGPSRVPGIGTVAEYERSGTVFVPHMDHRGTAMAWSIGGASVGETAHTAFGQILTTGAAQPNTPFEMSYQSDWLIAQNKGSGAPTLYLTPSGRIYHTGLGRFLQRDKEEYMDGSDQYAYVDTCPTDLTDPSGYKIALGSDIKPRQLGPGVALPVRVHAIALTYVASTNSFSRWVCDPCDKGKKDCKHIAFKKEREIELKIVSVYKNTAHPNYNTEANIYNMTKADYINWMISHEQKRLDTIIELSMNADFVIAHTKLYEGKCSLCCSELKHLYDTYYNMVIAYQKYKNALETQRDEALMLLRIADPRRARALANELQTRRAKWKKMTDDYVDRKEKYFFAELSLLMCDYMNNEDHVQIRPLPLGPLD